MRATYLVLGLAAAVVPPGAVGLAATPAELLSRAGVRGGLVVHVGCGDGAATAALRLDERFIVQGLDADAGNVRKARQHIRSLGLYGPVTVVQFDGRHLPYTDGLVNAVVCDRPGEVPMAEILRVLAPRGAAVVGGRVTVKPWPDDIDEWTHFLHGPDNNAVAKDTRIGPPKHMQWKAGPMWCRSHEFASSIAAMVSAHGRLCYVVDEGIVGQPRGVPALWKLVGRDAFSGVLLWKRPLAGGVSARSLAAAGERLFLSPGGRWPLEIIDSATGRTLAKSDAAKGAREIIVIDDVVLAAVRKGGGTHIVAVSAADGSPRWDHDAGTVLPETLAARDGRVCYHNGKEVVCLALADGAVRWRAPSRGKGGMLVMQAGSVLFPGARGLEALDPRTGKRLWTGPRVSGRAPNYFVADGLVWRALAGGGGRSFLWTPQELKRYGYDPVTGQIRRTVEVKRLITPGHHWRCYPPKATDRYLLLHKRGVEFVDLRGGNHMRHNWLRAPCRHGVFPANGILYMPPSPCFCYPGVLVSGFNALVAGRQPAPTVADGARLRRGEAFGRVGKAAPAAPEAADWPMYRHDALRSGRAGCAAPAKPTPAWEARLGGTLTPPVAADGRLCLAEKDSDTVYCLDAATGKTLWHYTAGGRVDSPPTLYRGMVLFGSADGWVTCLRASDGAVVWRFFAAPAERRIVAFNRVESAWPVHGSVMVTGSLAYVAAGRSSYLDGGIYLYALRPETGEVVHRQRLWSGRPDVNKDAGRPFDIDGCRTDLLVSDGTDLYMLQERLGTDLSRKPAARITKLGDREVGLHLMATDGFLDPTWFNRTFWMYSRRWPGYYFSYKGPKSGQILVFDEQYTYGLHVFSERRGHSPEFLPGTEGYELFADRNTNEPVLPLTEMGREKGLGFFRTQLPKWTLRVPVRAVAMVLCGERLLLAGPPDVVPEEDPMAAFEGRLGARLWVVSAADGRRLHEMKLDEMPVFDGMIATEGRLYVATTGGKVICLH